MRILTIANRLISDDSDPFVVAEIGSNHMGDFELCKRMFIEAKQHGADAVKLQKRDNELMFTKTLLAQPYDNEESFGKTYGEHRRALDWFGEKEYHELILLAKELDIIFFATAFDPNSAEFLYSLNMPAYKIASCDVKNIPLIQQIAGYGKPMIISTGGALWEDIDRIVYDGYSWKPTITPEKNIEISIPQLALLHCISTYPNEKEHLNLISIEQMRKNYKFAAIGYSSHHPGLISHYIAYLLGARIFEVHFTLNRAFKGTDHKFSLEPKGLETLTSDLKKIKSMLGTGEKKPMPEELQGFIRKMGKSLYPSRDLHKGHKLTDEDVIIKAPADGLPPYEDIVGMTLKEDCSTGVAFKEGMLDKDNS